MSSPPSLQAPPSPTPPHSATSDTATTTTTTKSRKRSSSASTNQSPASPRSTSTSPVPPVSTLPLPLPLPLPPSLPDHNHQPEQHQPLDDGALPPAAKRLRRSSSSSPAPVSPSLSQSHSRSRSRSPSPQHLPPPNTTSQLSIRVESGARLAYYHSLILKHLSLAHRLLCLTQNGHEACESQAGPMLTAPGALIAPFDDVDALMRFVDPALDVDADADNNNLLPRNIFLIACAIIATCLDLLDPTDSVLVPLSIPLAKLLCQVTLVLCDIYTDDHIVTDVNVYEGFEPNDPLLARQERYAHRISLNLMHQVTDMIARAAWPARGEGASVWFDLGVIKALQVEGMVHFESRVKVVVVEDEVVSAMAWLERGIMGTASPQLMIERIVQASERIQSIISKFESHVNKNPGKAHIFLSDPEPITTTLLHSLLGLIHHAWYTSRDLAANSPSLMAAWAAVLRDLADTTGSMSYARQAVQRAVLALTRTLRPAATNQHGDDGNQNEDEDDKFATQLHHRHLLIRACFALIYTLTHPDDDSTLADTGLSPPPVADRMDEVVATCGVAHAHLCWMLDPVRRAQMPARFFNWARKTVKRVVDECDAARLKAGTKGLGRKRLTVPDVAIGVAKKHHHNKVKPAPVVVEVAEEDHEMDVDVENVPEEEAVLTTPSTTNTATGDAMDVDPTLVSVLCAGAGGGNGFTSAAQEQVDVDQDSDEEDDSDFDPDQQSDDDDDMDIDSSDEDEELELKMLEVAEMLAAQAEAGDPELLALLAAKQAQVEAEAHARAMVQAEMDEEETEEDQEQEQDE